MTTLFFLLTTLFLEKPLPIIQNSMGNAAVFNVRVEQKKLDAPIVNHEVTLKKKFFDLVFEFNEKGAVCVAASFDSLSFTQAKSGFPAKNIDGFKDLSNGGGMAESNESGQAQQGLTINREGFHYWFYDNRRENRFTRTTHEETKITCWRTIGIIEMSATKQKLDLKSIDKPLYLVFTSPDGGQVEYLKINWK